MILVSILGYEFAHFDKNDTLTSLKSKSVTYITKFKTCSTIGFSTDSSIVISFKSISIGFPINLNF